MASIHLLGRRRHLGPVRERPKTITRFTRIHLRHPRGAFFCVRPAGRTYLKVKVLYSAGKGTGSGARSPAGRFRTGGITLLSRGSGPSKKSGLILHLYGFGQVGWRRHYVDRSIAVPRQDNARSQNEVYKHASRLFLSIEFVTALHGI